MNEYTPQLFPSEADRIVPPDEGRARLAAIRQRVEDVSPAPVAPKGGAVSICEVGSQIWMQHNMDKFSGRCTRCSVKIL